MAQDFLQLSGAHHLVVPPRDVLPELLPRAVERPSATRAKATEADDGPVRKPTRRDGLQKSPWAACFSLLVLVVFLLFVLIYIYIYLLALDQNPNRTPNRTPSEHPNPTTKIGSKMGGELTYPKWYHWF